MREVPCRQSKEVLWLAREEGLTGVRPPDNWRLSPVSPGFRRKAGGVSRPGVWLRRSLRVLVARTRSSAGQVHRYHDTEHRPAGRRSGRQARTHHRVSPAFAVNTWGRVPNQPTAGNSDSAPSHDPQLPHPDDTRPVRARTYLSPPIGRDLSPPKTRAAGPCAGLEEAVQGKGESCPSLLGARRLRTCRFRSSVGSQGGPAWAEILAEPPTSGGRRYRPKEPPAGGCPLVPGSSRVFRARVLLPADGPTHPTPRLPLRGEAPPFPHPEPPLFFVFIAVPVARRAETTMHLPTRTFD